MSLSLGNLFPRKSDIYLSGLGAVHAMMSGRGCSLNTASRSSLVMHLLRCLSKYFLIHGGGLNVPSLDVTREAGSNGVMCPSYSESDSELEGSSNSDSPEFFLLRFGREDDGLVECRLEALAEGADRRPEAGLHPELDPL